MSLEEHAAAKKTCCAHLMTRDEGPAQSSKVLTLAMMYAMQASRVVGKRLAERAKAAGIEAVHWDRKRGQKFHGKIKELLQTMQAEGLPLN